MAQQSPQAVGELNLAGPIAGRCLERRKDIRGQDVATDDREV
jgi:hypothetical protein